MKYAALLLAAAAAAVSCDAYSISRSSLRSLGQKSMPVIVSSSSNESANRVGASLKMEGVYICKSFLQWF